VAEYRLTFGQQYAREPHPKLPAAHPDGWVTILVEDEDSADAAYAAARVIALRHAGRHWCDVYEPGDDGFDEAYWQSLYPRGELLRIGVDGVIADFELPGERL
jgi:hypothetical protein